MAIELTAAISAPKALVFTWLRDLEKVPLWVREVEKAYFTFEPQDRAIGTTFVQHIRQGLQLNKYNCEVVEFSQDEWLRVRMTGDSLIMEVDYRLVDTDNGCSLTWQTSLTSRSMFGAFMGMVFNGFSEPVLRRQLAELKRLTEAEHQPPA